MASSQLENRDAPRVVAIVLNWNRWGDTIECLESVRRATYPVHRLLVVDNASTDDSVEQIIAWSQGHNRVESQMLDEAPAHEPMVWVEYDRTEAESGGVSHREAVLDEVPAHERLVVVQIEENLGFAGGMNAGIRYAQAMGAEYVWLLNNDTVVSPDSLSILVDTMEAGRDIAMVGPLELDYYDPQRIVDSFGFVYPWRGVTGGVPRDLVYDGCVDVELLSGFNLLVRTAVGDRVGLMDEKYFLYVEETEWCIRMRRGGWRLVHVPEAKVWHKGSQSTGWGSPLMYYYSTRNQLRLFTRHYPYALPCVIARSILRMIKVLVRGRWDCGGATARGLFDWARGRSGMM